MFGAKSDGLQLAKMCLYVIVIKNVLIATTYIKEYLLFNVEMCGNVVALKVAFFSAER